MSAKSQAMLLNCAITAIPNEFCLNLMPWAERGLLNLFRDAELAFLIIKKEKNFVGGFGAVVERLAF